MKQTTYKILGVIPARSGSKSLPNKNIKMCNGKPLLAYSIEHAKQSKYINRIIISTDSPEYARIAGEYGAEIPFIRPQEISRDDSTDFEVFWHGLNFLKEKESYSPDILVHLRPTFPIRNPNDIDAMIKIAIENADIDSVRSVIPSPLTPYKMWHKKEDNVITPVAVCDLEEAYNAPRQILPVVYFQNACIDVIRTATILEKKSVTGDKISGYVQDFCFDIDSEYDFARAEFFLELYDKINVGEKLTLCFDIDGVIAEKTLNNDYSSAKPVNDVIKIIDEIFDNGHEIILHSARGSKTGIDWKDVTYAQLQKWGVKYNELHLGKPFADIYIDDRFMNMEDLSKISNLLRSNKK